MLMRYGFSHQEATAMFPAAAEMVLRGQETQQGWRHIKDYGQDHWPETTFGRYIMCMAGLAAAHLAEAAGKRVRKKEPVVPDLQGENEGGERTSFVESGTNQQTSADLAGYEEGSRKPLAQRVKEGEYIVPFATRARSNPDKFDKAIYAQLYSSAFAKAVLRDLPNAARTYRHAVRKFFDLEDPATLSEQATWIYRPAAQDSRRNKWPATRNFPASSSGTTPSSGFRSRSRTAWPGRPSSRTNPSCSAASRTMCGATSAAARPKPSPRN